MDHNWQMELKLQDRPPAMFLPPALVEETAWDILMALHSVEGKKPSLEMLRSVVSAPQPILLQWLSLLEEGRLITGEKYGVAQEIRAVLTPAGREILDRYLSVTSDLQIGAHH